MAGVIQLELVAWAIQVAHITTGAYKGGGKRQEGSGEDVRGEVEVSAVHFEGRREPPAKECGGL